MKIAIVIPRFVDKSEIWGESLIGMALQESFQHCYPKHQIRLFDPTNLFVLNESYDLILSLWNDPNLDKGLAMMRHPFRIFWMVSAPTNMQRLFTKETNPYDLVFTHSATITEQLCKNGIPAALKFTGVNTRLFHYIPPTKPKVKWCFLGNYDNPRRKASFDKWLQPFTKFGNELVIAGNGWNTNTFDKQYAKFQVDEALIDFASISKFYSSAYCGLAICNEDMLAVDMIPDRVFNMMPCCEWIANNLTMAQQENYYLNDFGLNLDLRTLTYNKSETDIVLQMNHQPNWQLNRQELIKKKYDMDDRVKQIVEIVEAQKQ